MKLLEIIVIKLILKWNRLIYTKNIIKEEKKL